MASGYRARVYVLVDARHGLKDAELTDRIAQVEAALAKWPGAFPGILVTSAREGSGLTELRAAIARLLAERKR